MSAGELRVGDIGTVIELTVKDGGSAVNISAATTKQIKFRKPNGTTVTKTAVFTTDGTDGKIKYTTVADDLDTAGIWRAEAYLAGVGGWTGKSDFVEFRVQATL